MSLPDTLHGDERRLLQFVSSSQQARRLLANRRVELLPHLVVQKGCHLVARRAAQRKRRVVLQTYEIRERAPVRASPVRAGEVMVVAHAAIDAARTRHEIELV